MKMKRKTHYCYYQFSRTLTCKMPVRVIILFLLLTIVPARFCAGQNDNFSLHLIDSLSGRTTRGPLAAFILPDRTEGYCINYFRMSLEKQDADITIKITKGKEVAKVLPDDSLEFLFVFEDTVYYQAKYSLAAFMDTMKMIEKSHQEIDPVPVQVMINNAIIFSGTDRSAQLLRQ